MKHVTAAVQINKQGPVTAWKEKAHVVIMRLFMFPTQPPSWNFSRIQQSLCCCYHYRGQNLSSHIHRGKNSLFFFHILCSYEGRSLRSLVNKKTSRRTVLWLCSTMTFLSVPCKYASSIGLLPEVSSVVWFLVSFPNFLEF